jgi:hypothetical protein
VRCNIVAQVQDEIFGPVLSVGKFTTEEQAIKLANNTAYGLGAGLHSSTLFASGLVSFGVLRSFAVWRRIGPSRRELANYSRLPDDANQCMRVSSALEAGTVSFLLRIRVPSFLDEILSLDSERSIRVPCARAISSAAVVGARIRMLVDRDLFFRVHTG